MDAVRNLQSQTSVGARRSACVLSRPTPAFASSASDNCLWLWGSLGLVQVCRSCARAGLVEGALCALNHAWLERRPTPRGQSACRGGRAG